MIKEIPKYHTKWEIREEEYSKVVLTDVLEIHIIELSKLTKQLKEDIISPKDKVALWAKFIINPDMIGEDIMSENEDIKKANEVLNDIQKDEHEKYLAHLRLKYILDKNSGERANYEKGMKETQKKVILNLHQMKITIEDICKAVDLTKEEVDKYFAE